MKGNNLIFIACIALFFSCKTTERVVSPKLKTINPEILIERINNNSFDYQSIEIKKIIAQVEAPDKKSSFRANLKSNRDEFILLSVNKLTILAAKMMLIPDSLIFINYIDKYWLTGGYEHLENMFNIGIKFADIQQIISNNVLCYCSEDFSNLVSYIDSGYYVLKLFEKNKEILPEEDFFVRYLYVDPKSYKIRKIIFDNKRDNEHIVINFSGYENVEGQLYPGIINLDYQGETFLRMNLKLSGVEINKGVNKNFNIPGNYKKIESIN